VRPVCLTCPCPGKCELDPCRDTDKDGWGDDCTSSVYCSNLKGRCDCAPNDPAIHPGAAEICGNGVDDNCNSQIDETCTCTKKCGGTLDCAPGSTFCSGGCCESCPTLYPMDCLPGLCPHSGGVDLNGCPQQGSCGYCCACPAIYAPVCGTNYGTYGSPCEAQCAGVAVLHDGACLPGEGVQCTGANGGECGPTMYCRDPCPLCAGLHPFRCTQMGTCSQAWDCPAGLIPPSCSRGSATWQCNNHKCQAVCP
jgi:hypothetical protein